MIQLEEFDEVVSSLTRVYETKEWWKLLRYVEHNQVPTEVLRKYLWSWPKVQDLKQLSQTFNNLKVQKILSVGCGNGLLEWLLQESLNLEVYGLEVDRDWWQSKYAITPFITTIRYLDEISWTNLNEEEKGRFIQKCSCSKTKDDWDFALMFCYFNDRNAFLRYLSLYKGLWLLIIGPTVANNLLGIYTDPLPLEKDFSQITLEAGAGKWLLHTKSSMGSSNILALYKRVEED